MFAVRPICVQDSIFKMSSEIALSVLRYDGQEPNYRLYSKTKLSLNLSKLWKFLLKKVDPFWPDAQESPIYVAYDYRYIIINRQNQMEYKTNFEIIKDVPQWVKNCLLWVFKEVVQTCEECQ